MVLSQVMNIIRRKEPSIQEEKKYLIKYLKELKALEAKLWGVTINHLSNDQEQVLEDANHLIYLISKEKIEELSEILSLKEVSDFTNDIRNLKNDFVYLKKQITKKEKLKNLIASYTIKLVDKKTYSSLEPIFLLEKQLYEVLEKQEEELETLTKEINSIKIDVNGKKIDLFLESLNKIRKILAGHMDHHSLWEEEKEGYSNVSNILTALIREVESSQ